MLNTQITPFRFLQDILRFLYIIFFKPISLRRYFYRKIQTDDPSLFKLWRERKSHPEFIPIIQLAFFHIITTPFLAFPIALFFQLLGFEVNWSDVAVGVAVGVALGVALGVAGGVALGVAGGVAYGVAAGVAFGVAFGVALGVAFGVAVGVALGVALGVAFGVALGVAFGVAVGVAFGVVFGLAGGVAGGVAFGVVFILSYLRLPLYVFQVPWSFIQARWFKGEVYMSPIAWDEMIWFPLPSLETLLVHTSHKNRATGQEAIAFVASSFRQGWAARKAILQLTAEDVSHAKTLEEIGEISKTLAWLPEETRDDYKSFLVGVDQISQHARAALESETIYNRQEQLRNGLELIRRMNQGFALDNQWDFSQQMIPALQVWENVFSTQLSEVNTFETIPNVYVAGSPLVKNSKAFKGRKDLFGSLNNELVNPSGQRPAMLLFGARRMGKTSTLKQLPVQLGPQIIPVSIDLQKATTVENASGLLYLIAREINKSALEERRLSLPELTKPQLENDPYLVFQEWLEEVEKKLKNYYWILLALDEYEALGDMKESGRVDDRIFQLLRGIIQGHPRFTILMSGSHTLEDLPPYWSNYFINTKMLKVDPLRRGDAIELITHPIENFPLTYDENAVDLLISETGCHPNWLQLACRETVEKLNNEKRFHAKIEDVQTALAKVPQVLAGDFKDLWEGEDSNDLMRSVLKFIAISKNSLVDEKDIKKNFLSQEDDLQTTLTYLTRRDILVNTEGQYKFNALLLRRWVSKQK